MRLLILYNVVDPDIQEMDQLITNTVKGKFIGSGCYLPTMTRDIEFEINDLSAVERVKALGIKGLKISVREE